MKHTHFLLSVFVLLFFLKSCKENVDLKLHAKVELYEIGQFETIDNTDQIDESTVITKKNPLLKYEDLLLFNAKEYKFIISVHGQQLFEDPPIKTGAFALKANGDIIYTGYFVPSYSSRLWFWNTIDDRF